MTLKLKGSEPTDICVKAMHDGDLAVITRWDDVPSYCGNIVQRVGDDLVEIGRARCDSWPEGFKRNFEEFCRVRLLKSGDVLEVQ